MIKIELENEEGKVVLMAALMAVDNAEWLAGVLGVSAGKIVYMAGNIIIKLIVKAGLDRSEIQLWLDCFKEGIESR